MEEKSERRRRFFPSVSLGSIIATLAFLGASAGVYAQFVGDIKEAKTEIISIKAEQTRKEKLDYESRQEIKGEVRDVNRKLEKVNDKLDRILEEMAKNPQRGYNR